METRSLGRFSSPALLILFCLQDGPKRGHAIITMIDERSGIVLEPGTLYAALARLEQRGWVVPLQSEAHYRSYRLTEYGYTVLQQTLTTLHEKFLYEILAAHPLL